jgi:hypothetical protein
MDDEQQLIGPLRAVADDAFTLAARPARLRPLLARLMPVTSPRALATPFPPVTDDHRDAGRRSLQCPHPAAKLAIAGRAEW